MSATTRPVLGLAGLLGLIGLLLLLASDRLARPVVVVGRSMEPALAPGDRLLVDLWTYRHRRPRAGEVVWLQGPLPQGLPLIKRAQAGPGFPGDRPRPDRWPAGMARDAGVWVRGDNPAESGDSRSFGAVPAGRVRGRAFWRYWPPERAGPLREAPAAPAGFGGGLRLPLR